MSRHLIGCGVGICDCSVQSLRCYEVGNEDVVGRGVAGAGVLGFVTFSALVSFFVHA